MIGRAALALLLLQDPGAIAPALDPVIEGFAVSRHGDELRVSFRVANAFTDDLVERIHSGIPVAFRHRVRVLARRGLPLMPAREIGRTRIDTQVTYDGLTGQYVLVRETDFRRKKTDEAVPPEERVTASEAEMRAFMTEFTDVPVIDPDPQADEPLSGSRVRVKVDANLGRRFWLLIIPTTRGADADIPLDP